MKNLKKYLIGFILGIPLGIAAGINIGRDAPLWSNPFTNKPDIPERVKQETKKVLEGTKEAIHEATKPGEQ
jgi:hypothetical protein